MQMSVYDIFLGPQLLTNLLSGIYKYKCTYI